MSQPIKTVFVILFAFASWVKCDICDICVCTKSECEASNDVSNGASNGTICLNQVDEYFVCDGSESKINEENRQSLDFNSIQWPNKNITVSATFNHFKLNYLTK